MLNPYVSSGVYCVDFIIILLFFSRTAPKRMAFWKCLLLGLALFQLGSAVNLLSQNNIWINTLFSFAIRVGFALVCFRTKKFAAVAHSAILVVLNLAIEIIAVLIISAATGSQAMDYNNNLALLLIECSFSKLLFLVTSLILSQVIVPDVSGSRYQFMLLLYPLLSSSFLIVSWYVSAQPGVTANVQYTLAGSSVAIFLSSVLLFMIYQHQIEGEREHIRIKAENERLQTEKAYYDILEQQNQKLMIYAHDVKKHLNAIQAINTDPAIEQYMSALVDQLKNYTKNCHSGNMMLDVMVDKYVMDCERLRIQFDYDVRNCNLRDVEDIDLVAILGNLLDNAVASAERSEEKCVTLETTMRNEYGVLIITNSCDMPPISNGGQLITTKADRKLHGHGLKSVSRTLKKYGGDFRWDYDETARTFIITIMIMGGN